MNLYFLCRRYIAGEAWTNRILAYAKGFAENGLKVVVVYLISDKNRTTYDINIPGVEILNMWKRDGFFSKKSRLLSFFCNLTNFKNILTKEDIVFVYGGSPFLTKTALRATPNVFCEITEIPFYGKPMTLKRKFIEILWMKVLKQTKGLFVISNTLKSHFLSRGFKERHLKIVNMFVDASRFNGLVKDNSSKYIGYCGVVSKHKDGVDDLIQAFSLFSKTHKDYTLKIAGRFESPQTKEELMGLSRQLGLEEKVIFMGPISPIDMPKFLTNASILALARPDSAQARNGFPTKLGEYLCTGNPIVVTSVGDIPLFIKDKVNGYLAKPDDPEDFSKVLIYVADHYESAKLVGEKGKMLTVNEFSNNKQSKIVQNFIESHL